jgi:DNA repair photolyase
MEPVIDTRKSQLLRPSPLLCLGSLPVLRLASGCIHGCLDCYAQGSCGQTGSQKVVLANNCLTKLREELARRHPRPAAVCFDFSSDPFQPVPELLDRSYEVLDYLLGEGMGVVFQTKAKIPQRHMELLLAHPTLVRAIIGLLTIDRRLLRFFEPAATTPRTRLSQMRQLVAGGVATLARVDPILPGLSDDPDALHGLCAALAEAGVCEIAAGTLVLRPALVDALRNRLNRPQIYRRLTQAFAQGKSQRFRAGGPAVRVLPAARRRKIFQWLTVIAGQYGIRVHVCACKNPDLAGESCRLAGRWSPPEVVERQLALFSVQEAVSDDGLP